MATFDYAAARKAGHTDDEIAQFLQSQQQAGNNLTIDKNEYAKFNQPPAPQAQQPGRYRAGALENVANNTIGGGTFAATLGKLLGGNTQDARSAQASSQGLSAMNQKLMQHAQQYAPTDPRRARELQLAGQNAQLQSGQAQQQLTDLPTPKNFLGSAAQLALTAGGAAAPAGQSLRARTLISAIQGAGQGAAQGYGNVGSPGTELEFAL